MEDKKYFKTNEYRNIHYNLRKKNGQANKCEFTDTCTGKSKRFQWALKKGRQYSTNPEDYFQLCCSCHIKYDKPEMPFRHTLEVRKKMSERMKGSVNARKGMDSRATFKCKYCSSEYKSRKKDSKFCSKSCASKDTGRYRDYTKNPIHPQRPSKKQ